MYLTAGLTKSQLISAKVELTRRLHCWGTSFEKVAKHRFFFYSEYDTTGKW